MTEGEKFANGAIASISEKLIRVLPPAFLMLVIINILFLGVATWVFSHNTDKRNELLSKIVEKCLLQNSAINKGALDGPV